MDILLVIGFLFLGACLFVFVQLALILFFLRENERMQTELERDNEDFWNRIEDSNNSFK